MPSQVDHGEIVIDVLEELVAKCPARRSIYPQGVDAALLKYGPKIMDSALTWRAIAKALNEKFGLNKSPAAYEKRYHRVTEFSQ